MANVIKSPTGTKRSCLGWHQEAALTQLILLLMLSVLILAAGCAPCPYLVKREMHPGDVALAIRAVKTEMRENEPIQLVIEQKNCTSRTLVYDWHIAELVFAVDCATQERHLRTYIHMNGSGVINVDKHGHLISAPYDREAKAGETITDTLWFGIMPPGVYQFEVTIPNLNLKAMCRDTVKIDILRCDDIAAMMGHPDSDYKLANLISTMADHNPDGCKRVLACVNAKDPLWLASAKRKNLLTNLESILKGN